MHVLDVRWRWHDGTPSVQLCVDGTDLRDLAARAEDPLTGGDPGTSGDYAPMHLAPEEVVPQFTGAPVRSARGRTVLLSCTCGDWSCSPLVADVRVDAATVTWRAFSGGVSPDDLAGLGPFVFDRAQYERALRAVAGRPPAQDSEASPP